MENEENTKVIDVSASPSITDVQTRIEDMLSNRRHVIEKVKPLLIEEVDIYTLPGMKKPSLGKPGAEKLAAIFGLRASFKIDRETIDAIGQLEDGKKYVAYVCTLTSKGDFSGEGRGATFIEWKRNSYRRVFKSDLPTLTQEENKNLQGPFNGTSKTGSPYEYWKLPEAPVFDQLALNKSIKMAQKSAFVDAVIRTTGMSDLFTQDVEDMEFHSTEEASPPIDTRPLPKTPITSALPNGPKKKLCEGCGNAFDIKPGKEWAKECFDCWKKKNPIKKPTEKAAEEDEIALEDIPF